MRSVTLVGMLLLAFVALGDDVTVTTPGECNFPESGAHSFGNLKNAVDTGTVTFTQTGNCWNKFTGFDAVATSISVFDGVFFDFGGGTFLNAAADNRSVVLQGGTAVTNIAQFTTSTGAKNTISISDSSRLHITGDMILDANNDADNRNVFCTVSDGGKLFVGGRFALCTGKAGGNKRYNSGDRLIVSNANSYVKLGSLTLGIKDGTVDGAGKGGNQAWVTDFARMDVGTISTGIGTRSFDNRIYITDGGVVTAATVNICTSRPANYNNLFSGDEVNVWNGGALRVNGTFTMGYTSTSATSHQGMKLVVSNGTFSANKLCYPATVSGSNCEVRITGPLSNFALDSYANNTQPFNVGRSNRFIVEGGADVYYGWGGLSYGADTYDESIIARGEGSVFRFATLRTATLRDGNKKSYTNHFYVASGAVATGSVLAVIGDGCELTVSNAMLKVTSDEYDTIPAGSTRSRTALSVGYHDTDACPSTNCVVNICGSSPRIQCTTGATAFFRGGSSVVYHLPAEGYDEGVVPFDADKKIQLVTGCTIKFSGAEEMLAKHRALGKVGRKYVLMKAKTLTLPDGAIEDAQESLPEGMTLKLRTADDGDKELVLQVGKLGLVLMVR